MHSLVCFIRVNSCYMYHFAIKLKLLVPKVYKSYREKTGFLPMRKQRRRTAKLISAFVFANRIVQFLFFLYPKFQASSLLLRLYSPVCVGPGRKSRRPVFSRRGSYTTNGLAHCCHVGDCPLSILGASGVIYIFYSIFCL